MDNMVLKNMGVIQRQFCHIDVPGAIQRQHWRQPALNPSTNPPFPTHSSRDFIKKNHILDLNPIPSKDMQTPPHPPLLRSGHFDIKDAQCAENFISHHIAFGRCGRSKGASCAPKNSISFKSGQICRVDWN